MGVDNRMVRVVSVFDDLILVLSLASGIKWSL